VSFVHILRQGPMLATLARTVATSALSTVRPGKRSQPDPADTVYEARIPPRHPDLLRDYVREVGGDPASYQGIVPAHMFPQWGMPAMQRTIAQLPYNLVRILNAGCEYSVRGQLPADEPLVIRADLENVDDNGKRALITMRLRTGTEQKPALLLSRVTAMVPLKSSKERKEEGGESPKEPVRVPQDATEIARTRLPADAGLKYAYVSGDFNPVHWVLPYARLAGHRGTIVHGFAAVARLVEDLNRNLWSGRTDLLEKIEIRFLKPLVVPANVGTYIDGKGGVYVGEAPGEVAAFAGHYSAVKETRNG